MPFQERWTIGIRHQFFPFTNEIQHTTFFIFQRAQNLKVDFQRYLQCSSQLLFYVVIVLSSIQLPYHVFRCVLQFAHG